MDFNLIQTTTRSGRAVKPHLVPRSLDQDTLLGLMCRLPAESILKCKRVQKSWLASFRNILLIPNFAQEHVKCQLSQLHHFDDAKHYPSNHIVPTRIGILIEIEEWNSDEETYYDYRHWAYAEYHEKGEDIRITEINRFNLPVLRNSNSTIGSCDGLICMSKDDACVYIFNPMIGEYIHLPKCKLASVARICYGFGWSTDANTNGKEYKVVRIIYYQKRRNARIQVYTLGSAGIWRTKGIITHSLRNHPGAFVDGALNWVDSKGKVWAFSLSDEEFSFLTQTSSNKGDFDLVVLGGWLSYIEDDTLWSFKKISEEYQWSSIDIPYDSHPFALTNSGGALYWTENSLSVFDPNAEAPKELLIEDLENLRSRFYGRTHVNSFVSFKTIGEKNVKMIELGENSERETNSETESD